jgi:hypothetical protein
MRLAAVAFAVFLVAGVALAASRPATIPSAFARRATPADRLPAGFAQLGGSRPFDSRRIATYTDGAQRHWSVYVFKQVLHSRLNICIATLRAGGGGVGCSPPPKFFAPGRWVVAGEGHLIAGVAADNVAAVRLIGRHGTVHTVKLTRDHGFIYDCNAYNGCSCLISRVQAFDSVGRLITNQDWLGSSCRRR